MERAIDILQAAWPHLAWLTTIALSVVASAHAVLTKRDARAAIGWVGVIWLVPVIGAGLYVLFGINRIRRRAQTLRLSRGRLRAAPETLEGALGAPAPPRRDRPVELGEVAALLDRVTGFSLARGNRVEALPGGNRAYAAMLGAIAAARRSVTLISYIFNHDAIGRRFVDALVAAKQRGVEVRVLVDAVGARYGWPSALSVLSRRGVRAYAFNPTRDLVRFRYLNLRNHRKVLIADGLVAFTGGMNIREECLLDPFGRGGGRAVLDVHFQVEGPVVSQLQEIFAEDWWFTTGERLDADSFFPSLDGRGDVLARAIADGPDEDLDKLRLGLLAAIGRARRSVRIVTPYFLPDETLTTALGVAALSGVDVEVVVPAQSNLTLVGWATYGQLPRILEHGVRVHLTPSPFDHAKLMTVDGAWSLLGSANWDARSLRLNFELNLECYDRALAASLDTLITGRLRRSRPYTLRDARSRPLPVRLRDGLAGLFDPYL